jgi:L-threonylcarbamoyladenylate synthase
MEISEQQIQQALIVLRNGGVVVFPTETAYGLAADATNTRAVERVLAIKGREEGKTVALIASDLTMAERYLEFSARLHELAREFWPGPLTIVAKAKKGTDLSSAVIRENGTIALRVSSHPVATRLAQELRVPIVATSANRAGESSCYSVPAARQQLDAQPLQPDFYLDGGVLPRRKPSTIVKEVGRRLEIVRQGSAILSRRHLA